MSQRGREPRREPIEVTSTGASVTVDRKPATKFTMQDPAVPRVYQAATEEKPHGSEAYAEKNKDKTVLQQHVIFWDQDNDGVIWPSDTYKGFRDLGFNPIFSLIAVVIIHATFSYPTGLAKSYLPDPFFRLLVPSMHKAKHGSDSATFDNEGRFLPSKFEDIFTKYDRDYKGGLTWTEIWAAMSGYRIIMDPFGWFALFFEFGTTYLLCRDQDGVVEKEDMRKVYDGSLFFEIRDMNREASKGRGKGWTKGFGPLDAVKAARSYAGF
ncbi:hypothetical protein PROFUN_07675 [Planoprotostelium fungivorum]|uniref:Caleosin domain-containing protein n=1 Tax=Planoprotostelium fungivorum TaxID=1890364 RepID=A0A2P6MM49_9EUKA|nr:hypothetical protein PROFUN_07675 [Planoprotostelium fungivorum]